MSAPNLIINRWREGDFILIMTPQIEEEIAIVLTRKQVKEEMIVSLFSAFDDLAFYQEGIYETNFLDDIDPNDNMFLSACYESKADR